jgi:very-short-patch-repair endonuclease
VTFPSPVTDDRAVRYVHVPDGVYERGSGRVNREEARVVVADVVRRLKQPNFASEMRSIGIVTFNGDQQRLIENLLDQARRNDSDLEQFFDASQCHEPIFVKNLENVQGDERDIILFSVAVGPDQSGRVAAQISSLNKDGGHRRLNVAITRARRELVVFATLRPEQIDLSRTNTRGVRDFKHFLEFADRGARALAEAFAPTGKGTDSPFEDAVKRALEDRGWIVHPQVGVSGFRIDLGIVDPDAAGHYLAGVECDGATYHRSATARDRDRLREMVLTDLGWRIRRVWSTEWWTDADTASAKLHERLLADLKEEREREAERKRVAEAIVLTDTAEVDKVEVSAPPPEQNTGELNPRDEAAEPTIPPPVPDLELPVRRYADAAPPEAASRPNSACYRPAIVGDCGHGPDPSQFYDPLYRAKLRAMTAHVIEVEGPIFDDLLVTRIARAHGFSRAGGTIRHTVLAAVSNRFLRTEEDGRVIFWPGESQRNLLPDFREADDGVRDHSDVPLPELAALARRFVEDGADREEAVRRMASHLRLSRVRSSTRRRFEAAVDLLLADNRTPQDTKQ